MPRPANPEGERYREQAMLRLCEDLHRNPAAYRTVASRRARMATVITDHNLRELYNAGGLGESLQAFTVTRLERIAGTAASQGGTTTTALFREGPMALSQAYRQKLGYVPPPPPAPPPMATGGANAVANQIGGASQVQTQTSTTAPAGTATLSTQPANPVAQNPLRDQPQPPVAKRAQVIDIGDDTPEGTPATTPPSQKRKASEDDDLFGSAERQPKSPRLESKKRKADEDDTTSSEERPSKQARIGPSEPPTIPQTTQSSASSPDPLNPQPNTLSHLVPTVQGAGSGELRVDPPYQADTDDFTEDGASKYQPRPVSELVPTLQGRGSGDLRVDPPAGATIAAATEQEASTDPEQSSRALNRKRNREEAGLEESGRPKKSSRVGKGAPIKKKTAKKPTPRLKDWKFVSTVSNNKLEEEFNTIWFKTQNFANKIVAETGIDGEDKEAIWLTEPEDDLLAVYESAMGQNWRRTARTLNRLGITKAHETMEIIVSGAVNELVLKQPSPWPGPNELIDQHADMCEGYNDVLHEIHPGLEFQNVFWQAHRNKVKSTEFWNDEIAPRGKNLAEMFWKTLEPQLAEMGAVDPKHADCSPEQWYQERVDDLEYIFSHALLAQALMAISREIFSTYWPLLNTEYDDKKMKEVRISKGPRHVAFCVSPIVSVRKFKDSEEEWVRKARVYTRAPPEPYVQ